MPDQRMPGQQAARAHLRLVTMTPASTHARRGSARACAAVQNTLTASSATTAVRTPAFTLQG